MPRSSRRGAPTSGDIDIMVLHPTYAEMQKPSGKAVSAFSVAPSKKGKEWSSPLPDKVLKPLADAGILADSLSSGPLKWQGIARVPGRDANGKLESAEARATGLEIMTGEYRRADITYVPSPLNSVIQPLMKPSVRSLVPQKGKGAAMIQLTGDLDFNIDCRARAQQMGMLLNEYGLWRWTPNPGKEDPEIKAQHLFEKETEAARFPQYQDGSFASNFQLGLYGYLSLLGEKSTCRDTAGFLSSELCPALRFRVVVGSL